MKSKVELLQQKYLTNTVEYSKLIESLSLTNKIVLEIGCGTGVLTDLIMKQQPQSILGFEIDRSVFKCLFDLQIKNNFDNFVLYEAFSGDSLKKAIDELNITQPLSLIANPPYDLLDTILEVIEELNIANVILMTSESRLNKFKNLGYTTEFVLDGSSFSPSSTGLHYVIRKGF